MAGGLVAFALIAGSGGLLILLLGYLIKAKQMASLISGYDPRKVKDVRGLTDWVGGSAMLMGAVTCAYGLIPMALGRMPGPGYHLGFGLALIVFGIWTAVKANRF